MQPWFESDVKIYTPRVRTSYEGAEDTAGELCASTEQEALSLWNPACMRVQHPTPQICENQPYTEP